MNDLSALVEQISSRNRAARDKNDQRSQELLRIAQHGDHDELNRFIDRLAADSDPSREPGQPDNELGETGDGGTDASRSSGSSEEPTG